MPHLGVNAITIAGRLLAASLRAWSASSRRRAARPALRSALDDAAGDADRRRHRRPTSCRCYCWFDLDVRALPGVDVRRHRSAHPRRSPTDECVPEMRRVAPEAGDRHYRRQPGAAVRGRDKLRGSWRWRCKLAGQNETHAVSYATEAGLFQEAGSPPSSSVPATSRRRIRPMSSSPRTSSTSAWPFSTALVPGPSAVHRSTSDLCLQGNSATELAT